MAEIEPTKKAAEAGIGRFMNNQSTRTFCQQFIDSTIQEIRQYSARQHQVILNGHVVKSKTEVENQLKAKQHDTICKIAFSKILPILLTKGCVKGFEGMEQGCAYESVRSQDLAHRIHVEKMEQGVLDFEPLAPGFKAAGDGVKFAGLGLGFAFAAIGVGLGIGLGVGAMGVMRRLAASRMR